MSSLLDPTLTKAYEQDRTWLTATKLPIITVAGTFREDVKDFHHLPDNNSDQDVVFSRAHFSMALGAAVTAWQAARTSTGTDPKKLVRPEVAWIADPTNFVSPKQWSSIELTQFIGHTLARHRLLKIFKDFIDQFGRNKLPILPSITPPLLHLTEHVERPILSFHIAAGNILAEQGRRVIQMVTDPHVRPEYVLHAGMPNMQFCVFDQHTKLEFLEMAAKHHTTVHSDKIIVTGPPIDPRIVAARSHKKAWRNGPIKLCITTGGLGTNKSEIRRLCNQLFPAIQQNPQLYKVIVYAGTQKDIAEMVKKTAQEHHLVMGHADETTASLRLLYHPQIFDANELLIRYGFPWADGFITKPSGDMAYDAVAAGCFLLTLQEWGVWEERIRDIFLQKEIARRADTDHILAQLAELQKPTPGPNGHCWIETAMNHAFGIEKLFLQGSQNIVKVAQHA